MIGDADGEEDARSRRARGGSLSYSPRHRAPEEAVGLDEQHEQEHAEGDRQLELLRLR